MSDIKKLVKDISRGIQLKKNLPVYGRALSDTYLNYAAIELTFSAYILFESVLEDEGISEEEKMLYEEVISKLRQLLTEKGDGFAGIIAGIKEIRDKITAVMDVFTSYTDRLICYEYVLKRMELRFSEERELSAYISSIQEDDFVRRLMAFVVGNEDKGIVRDRLQMLMGQLPVHMTKNKFLGRVEEAATLYNGSDVSSLDGFVYMIRSAAMLHQPDESVVSAEPVRAFLDKMKGIDFSGLDSAGYHELSEELEQISERILKSTDFYYSLQKVVNGIYALCLVRKYEEGTTDVFGTCMGILETLVKGVHDDSGLVKLEGKIETYVEKSSFLEAVLFEVKSSCRDTLEEIGLYDEFEDYAVVANLLSDSLFIDIDKVKEDDIADADMIKKVSAELTDELSEMLGTLQKPVKRAVMAAVLEKIPASFANTDEIEMYVRTNLFGCQDFSEKGVVLLELEEMMNEAAEWRE